ncbi:MAG: hypothetical protein SGBAC_005859 [Bacillariaceae sp.]
MTLQLGPRVVPAAAATATAAATVEANSRTDCIKEVRAYCVREDPSRTRTAAVHNDDDSSSFMGNFVVQVELDNGIVGIGISTGGDAACYIVEKHLAKHVEGQDPSNTERIWETMFQIGTRQFGRQGVIVHAISAIDLAIWDVLGKLRKLPVYVMLGGKTKDKLQLYATNLRPDFAKSLGFHGARIMLPHGPSLAEQHQHQQHQLHQLQQLQQQGFSNEMAQKVDLIRNWRQIVGPDYPLIVHCNSRGLPVPCAIDLAQKCQGYNLKWIEEALPPNRESYDGYATLRERLPRISWAVGEHAYTRYDFKRLLKQNCSDVIRLNVTTCGGLTEARRIVAMASTYDDISVIPSGSVYGYHLQMAFFNCPLGEFTMLQRSDNNATVAAAATNGSELRDYFGSILEGVPVPSNGYIELSTEEHGFGIQLRQECHQFLTRPYNHSLNGHDEMRQTAAQNLVAVANTFSSPTASPTPVASRPSTMIISPPPTATTNATSSHHQLQPPPPRYTSSPLRYQQQQIKVTSPTKRAFDPKFRSTHPHHHPHHHPPPGFRRYLSNSTVEGLSYQESGDWCKKVGISLAVRKHERIHRLKEYLKGKPDGYKEY